MPSTAHPRRIALISSSFAPYVGGVEQHAGRVARELAALGHAVEVWTVDRGEHLGVQAGDGFSIRYLPAPLPARSTWALLSYAAQAPSAWKRWVTAHRAFQPDVLHVQCFGPNGLYALGLHRRFHTPLIVSSHGETFADDHAVFEDSALLRAGLRRAIARAYTTTGCSQFVLADLSKNFGLRGGEVVPNGVDPAGSVAGTPLWPMPYVLAVGRLGRPKGFDLLLTAYAASSLPTKGVRLVIGGEGEERAALQHQRRELDIEAMVLLPGRLSPEEVETGMARAKAVVVPSRVEAFGIVALEAWRGGAPLIMSNRGGGPGLVRDGFDGILVDPTDTACLADALDRLLSDRALSTRLSEAGLERVRAFTWAAAAAAYDQLYTTMRR